MKFRLIIDKDKEEEVVVTAHEDSPLIQQIRVLAESEYGTDRLVAYTEEGIKMLSVSSVECITVLDGKTYAIDQMGQKYRLKDEIYLEDPLLIEALFSMTPYYWRTSPSDCEKLDGLDTLETKIDINFLVYKKDINDVE